MNYIKLFVFIVSFNFLFPIVECENGQADGYPCSNMDLMSRLSLAQLGNPGNGNDIWGWVDPENGDPYALMGLDTGTALFE